MADEREKLWIQTWTGQKFYPLDPSPESVNVFDIAHALSNTCRYTGHIKRFYSVAEHSVRVARRVHELDPPNALWGLLHDASEAYIADIARPVKRQPALKAYRDAERVLQAAITARFGLDLAEPASVKRADNELLWTEAPLLFEGGLHPDWIKTTEQQFAPVPVADELGWAPKTAELRFLLEFKSLGGRY